MFFKACTTANEGNPFGRFSSRHSRGPALTVFNSFAIGNQRYAHRAESFNLSSYLWGGHGQILRRARPSAFGVRRIPVVFASAIVIIYVRCSGSALYNRYRVQNLAGIFLER